MVEGLQSATEAVSVLVERGLLMRRRGYLHQRRIAPSLLSCVCWEALRPMLERHFIRCLCCSTVDRGCERVIR